MKKSLLLFCLISGMVAGYAQTNLIVSGKVVDSTKAGVSGVPVNIVLIDSFGVQVTSMATTNVNGQFADTFSISAIGSYGIGTLTIVDCHNDTITKSIFWSPMHLLTNTHFNYCHSKNNTCKSFFFKNVVGDTAYLHASAVGLNLNYSWDFGDGTTGSGKQVKHGYSSNGAYLVCLTITDTINNCTDTWCDSITVPGPTGPCNAGFSYKVSNAYVTFKNTSYGGMNFHWDFGDGTTSTKANPVHLYTSTGTYNVCLIVNSPVGCSDTICQNITVSSTFAGGDIGGYIFTGNKLADYCSVYLIEHDSAAGTLNAVDSLQLTPVDSSYYKFTQVPQGKYLVKAALDSASSVYSNYLPTYFHYSLFWNTAVGIQVGPSKYHVHIGMIAGNNPGGPGFIGGLVSQGANKTQGPGDPVTGASVILLTGQDQPVTHTVSAIDGSYAFRDLAYGSYKIIVEIPGKISEIHYVTLTTGTDSIDDLNFSVRKSEVTTSITEMISRRAGHLDVFPNPADDRIYLKLNLKETQKVEWQLYNLSGQRILNNRFEGIAGNQRYYIGLENIPEGVYLIRLQSENGELYESRIVKMK